MNGKPDVLDASALLAWLQLETGADHVALDGAVMNSVNWSEVLQKAEQNLVKVTGIREELEALGLLLVPFSIDEGRSAADLFAVTTSHGLSLGDRACLATADMLGSTAVTAERAWAQVNHGVRVRVIR